MAEIMVLGAGMVGLGTALALQARGHAVTLVDRGPPGAETSHGNAGAIQVEAAEPYAMPRDLATLTGHALGRSNDVSFRWRDLPAIAPALWRYWRASAPGNVARIGPAYAALTTRAVADHAPLIAAAGLDNLVRRTGLIEIYRDPGRLQAAQRAAERMARTYGTVFEALDGPATARAEPALRRAVAGAILWRDPWSVSDPGALGAGYGALFERRGGRIVTADAMALQSRGGGWHLPGAGIDAEAAVVALGPWSPALMRRFGYRIPMLWKRGYHAHFRTPLPIHRPTLDTDHGVVLSSMAAGLRITTGAAFVARDAPVDLRQLHRGLAGARELFEIGEAMPGQVWHGHRPCLPEMLPLIGRAPRHAGLWVNFGHGHQGFTLGPTTGAVLAALFDSEPPPLAPAHVAALGAAPRFG
ncbi:NAD(P)/FAD-dependent oxidoreductase [Frigidibacter sp. MR17.24]|uniref:NAD(P)/FAD-dependent oxidoreductase n=1 Tax=Frigidibacter sp. MR17.24 TaxID=3127345 RepID=UPI003012B02D